MEPIIKVEGLSKRYRVGQGRRYGSLRESIVNKFKAPFRSRDGSGGESHFWALRDVGFEVHPGEILGLIGAKGRQIDCSRSSRASLAPPRAASNSTAA